MWNSHSLSTDNSVNSSVWSIQTTQHFKKCPRLIIQTHTQTNCHCKLDVLYTHPCKHNLLWRPCSAKTLSCDLKSPSVTPSQIAQLLNVHRSQLRHTETSCRRLSKSFSLHSADYTLNQRLNKTCTSEASTDPIPKKTCSCENSSIHKLSNRKQPSKGGATLRRLKLHHEQQNTIPWQAHPLKSEWVNTSRNSRTLRITCMQIAFDKTKQARRETRMKAPNAKHTKLKVEIASTTAAWHEHMSTWTSMTWDKWAHEESMRTWTHEHTNRTTWWHNTFEKRTAAWHELWDMNT